MLLLQIQVANPRKLEEIERRREKSKMLVDILLLLAGLVFSIDEPDVDKR